MNAKEEKGLLIGVCGPTCAGKTTVVQTIIKHGLLAEATRLITFTTRSPRNGEVDGVDYFFVTPERFEEMDQSGEFYEQSSTTGCRYGSSRKLVETLRASHSYVFAVMDFAGMRALKAVFPRTVVVGINATATALQRRLQERTWSSARVMQQRSWNACEEHLYLKNIAGKTEFLVDYVVENNHGEPLCKTDAPMELARYIAQYQIKEQKRSQIYAETQRLKNGC